MPSFSDFGLQPATCEALANMEIVEPTPIQVEAIPALLAGNDVVGQSATGSGKTLAYGVPLVERLARDKRVVQALVLVPTRELAIQVNTVLGRLAVGRRLTTALLVGGRGYSSQLSALRYGAQIVVGTPGRVKDHLDRGTLVLDQLRICVLDEADQMLDSGFAPAVEEILVTTPEQRQMALFSATMPDWVETLQQKFLKNSLKVEITPATGSQNTIEQIAYQVPQGQKMAALCDLLHSVEGTSSLVFGKTKYGVEKLGEQLIKLGFAVQTLHGNKSQNAREKVLTAFRKGQVQTLIATNVAARGLDITGIDLVINYELPESSELLTHRIGRTGRMGRQGKAITLLVPADVPKWRRLASKSGQGVALQTLTLERETQITSPLTGPETLRKLKGEQQAREDDAARDTNSRKPKSERQKREDSTASSTVLRKPKGGQRGLEDSTASSTTSRRLKSEQRTRGDNAVSGKPSRKLKSGRRASDDNVVSRATSRKLESGRRVPEDVTTVNTPGQRKVRVTQKPSAYTSTWQLEGSPAPERSFSGRSGDDKRRVGKPYRFGKTTRKQEARALTEHVPQRRTARRGTGATTTAKKGQR